MTDTTSVPFANNTNGNVTSTLATTTANDQLSFNAGDQGSVNEGWDVAASSTQAACFFQTPAGGLTGLGCAAGTWTLNFNMSSSTGTPTLDSVYIVRLDGSGNLISVLGNTATGLGVAVSSSMTVNVTVASVPAFGASDVVNVICNIHNANGAIDASGLTRNLKQFTTTLQQAGAPFVLCDDGLNCEITGWW